MYVYNASQSYIHMVGGGLGATHLTTAGRLLWLSGFATSFRLVPNFLVTEWNRNCLAATFEFYAHHAVLQLIMLRPLLSHAMCLNICCWANRRSPSYIDLERSWNSLAKKLQALLRCRHCRYGLLGLLQRWCRKRVAHLSIAQLRCYTNMSMWKNMLFSPTVVVRLVSVFLLSGGLFWASCV